MRINVMDGSLKEPGGHPHDIDLGITRAMVAAGHDVHVYCHIHADETVKSCYDGLAPITPLFSINPYAEPKSFDRIAGDIIKNLYGGHTTANELNTTRAADTWLWPSLYAHQLIACAIANPPVLVSGCIHHPPDFFSPADPAWWRHGFMQAHNSRLNLRVGVIEPETRYPYAPLTIDGNVSLFPFPHDGAKNPVQHHALKTVGIFGFQRQEKGGGFMPMLLQKLAADGYRVLLHDSNPHQNPYSDIPGITRIGYVANLDDEIAQCDLVLTPYQPQAYQYRGSGIVMNAMANGIPVVTPYGSAPGRLIEQNGAGILFKQYNLASIYAAVQIAASRYPAIAHAAHQASLRWHEQHGVMKFIAAMT